MPEVKATTQHAISPQFTKDLRPRGAPRSVRAGARMRATEVRKAGSSDPLRPEKLLISLSHEPVGKFRVLANSKFRLIINY